MREFNKPDVTAPRCRPTKTRVANQALYKSFKTKFPQYKHIPESQLSRIIKKFNESLWEHTLNNRDGVELLEGLGFIFIGTCPPPKKNNRDYDLSKELGQQVRHRNFESDNFLGKIFYTNFGKYKFSCREMWTFAGVRDFKRAVSKTYPDNWKTYLQVDNFTRVSRVFRKKNQKFWAVHNLPEIPEDYNEFDLD